MAGDLTASVGARVDEIMATAQQAAEALQREIEDAVAKRAGDVRLEAERDAQRIRAAAEAQAAQHLEEARRQVQSFADARVRRITDITDALIAAAESIPGRLEDAADV